MSVSEFPGADSTSSSLVRRVQASDTAAWERLASLYGPLIYQWAIRSGLDSHDAADIVQEVFQAVIKSIPRYTHRSGWGSFRGWMSTISRNKIHDFFRLRNRQTSSTGGTDAYLALQNLPACQMSDEASTAAERDGLQRRAMELLSGEFESRVWQAFWRTTIESESPAAVAANLGVSVWAVYKARARVLSRLREEFHDLLD